MANIMPMSELTGLAEVMLKSGYFKDVKDVAQASVKILAGQELGIPPIAALRGLDIVEGQISIRAHLMAAMIKNSGKYDYKVFYSGNDECIIEFFQLAKEGGHVLGRYQYTMEDAQKAGLANRGPWKQYTKIMLYNRAMSMGAKMYCPDIFLGAIYEEGEIETKPELRQIPEMFGPPQSGDGDMTTHIASSGPYEPEPEPQIGIMWHPEYPKPIEKPSMEDPFTDPEHPAGLLHCEYHFNIAI